MAIYTFHCCSFSGASSSFEAFELANDAEAFLKAGQLLGEHLSCDHIDVLEGERAVVARHRDQPVIRPVQEPHVATNSPRRQDA